jgi:hypothetical protein
MLLSELCEEVALGEEHIITTETISRTLKTILPQALIAFSTTI